MNLSTPPWREAGALTVDAIIRQRAALHPERTAIVAGTHPVTFGALQERVDRLARALRRLGVGRHDRIAILSENRIEYIEAILAAANLGAILACQNARQSDAELEHCVGLADPRVLLVSPRHAERIAAVRHRAHHVVAFGDPFERLCADAPAGAMPGCASPEDELLILYTSGTTGLPKGAAISHRAEVARAMIGAIDGQLYPGLGTVVWSPLYHIGGCDLALGVLMHGDPVHLVDGFQCTEILQIMAQEELGHVTLMPAMTGRVIAELHRSGLRPKLLRACGAMADLAPRHHIAELTTLLNARWRNTFGSTETGQPPASRHLIPIGVVPERLSKTQSSFCTIRLVDEGDRDVPVGTPGEVLFRGPSLFSGYWNAPEVNAHEFRGGWFHMGDVMVRNPDGTLDFVDRRKYMIKSGGENIYPAEIERVLLESPRIADVAVVRKADPHWGEVPVAFVVPADPALATADVLALCRGRIANYKLPKDVRFIAETEMPRSETSKVKRFELEARLRGEATAPGG